MTTMAWDAQPGFRPHAGRTVARRARTASTSTATLRLTRRGRMAVSMAAVAVALGLGLTAQSAVAESPRTAIPVATRTVAAGETLWEIAASVASPGEDRRDVVAELMSLNNLSDGTLQVGEQILVPAP